MAKLGVANSFTSIGISLAFHSKTISALSERDTREYVKRRKISGSTRNDMGKQCRDTFTSLKKTCRKLELSFWQYLKDRIEYQNKYPPLAEIMESRMVQSVG